MTRAVALAICAASLAACAARVPPRPGGPSTADPTAVEAFTKATASCKGLRSMSGALRLSGRAGSEKLRGTLLAGLSAPASIRFELVAPFGQPGFLLAGQDNRATLFIPRENRVLRDAAVPALLEKLTGLNLSASDLRLIITGCLAEAPEPGDGKSFAGDWQSVTLAAPGPSGSITAYLRTVNGARVVVAADYGAWRVDYANSINGYPRSVRIRSADGTIDLSAAIDDLAINVGLEAAAFSLTVPKDAVAMSLDDLRSVAPLREGK